MCVCEWMSNEIVRGEGKRKREKEWFRVGKYFLVRDGAGSK